MNKLKKTTARLALAVAVVAATSIGHAAAADLKSTYTGTALDFAQISQLFSRYDYTLDSGDGEGWADVFTANGVFRDPSWCAIGRQQLLDVVKTLTHGVKTDPHYKVPAHFHFPAMGPIVYVDRDHATIHSTVMVVKSTGPGVENGGILVTGAYDDKLTRVGGQWLFAYRFVSRPSDKPSVACAAEP